MKRKHVGIGVAIAALALIILLVIFVSGQQFIPGVYAQAKHSASAETPFGESIHINLGTSAQTSGSASWLAATAQVSQNVWTVNGTYKSQAQVTLGYSLQVSYTNVQNIQIVSLYIKALDAADNSNYQYVLASSKSLSGPSPISDSGSTTKTISQHLSDCQASTSSAQIKYYIYCKVQGQGTISGQTLVAEITETWFCTLDYQQSTESSQATVTPSVTVASWTDATAAVPLISGCLGLAGVGFLLGAAVKGKRRRRR